MAKRISSVCGAFLAVFGGALMLSPCLESSAQDAGPALNAPALPGNLNDMLTMALSSNPEILVAEAKVREAQAELNQVRLTVMKEVATLYGQRRNHEQQLVLLKDALNAVKQQVGAGQKPQEELTKAMGALASGEIALTTCVAQIRYVLGAGGETGNRLAAVGGSFAEEPPAGIRMPRPAIGDEFSQALDTPVQIDFEDKTLAEVFAQWQKAAGIPFVFQSPPIAENVVTLRLPKPLPLRVALLALHDVQREFCFIVREYGIMVAYIDEVTTIPGAAIPPDVPFEVPDVNAKKDQR